MSVDDVFDYLVCDIGSTKFKEVMKRYGKSEKLKQIAAGSQAYPFVVKERNAATTLLYRQLPLPWYVTIQCFGDETRVLRSLYTNPPRPHRPLTDRDVFIVQDYVRVKSQNDGGMSDETWFYTYNNDVDHPYFAPRSGFVRAKMKYYGLVGVLGDGGKTRLTWLVNLDFGGTVPSSFMNAMIVNLMVYPITIVENTTVHLQKKHGNVAAATSSAALEDLTSAAAKSKGADVDVELELPYLKAKLSEMKADMARKDVELSKKDEELTKKDEELKGKDEELRGKDEELRGKGEELRGKDEALRRKDEEHGNVLADKEKAHRSVLAEKDKEIMELRRRLPRVVEEEV